jgi:hypothetical protein
MAQKLRKAIGARLVAACSPGPWLSGAGFAAAPRPRRLLVCQSGQFACQIKNMPFRGSRLTLASRQIFLVIFFFVVYCFKNPSMFFSFYAFFPA